MVVLVSDFDSEIVLFSVPVHICTCPLEKTDLHGHETHESKDKQIKNQSTGN
jgi:hypothetical protein